MEKNEIKRFRNYEEIENFLYMSSIRSSGGFYGIREELILIKSPIVAQEIGDYSYSKTNIQVEGVDEADIVKTDGKYIYTISGNQIVIVDAYPAEEMNVVSRIEEIYYPSQIFVKDEYLIVFGSKSDYYYDYYYEGNKVARILTIPSENSFIKIYDLSDKQNPKLVKEIELSGIYFQSRMIDDYVYAVFIQNIYNYRPIPLPKISVDGKARVVEPQDIYYFDNYDYSYSFTTILSIDLKNMNYKTKTFLLGNSQIIYASKENMYLTFTWQPDIYDMYDEFLENVIIPSSPDELKEKIVEIKNSHKNKNEKIVMIKQAIYEYFNEKQEEMKDFYKHVEKRFENFEKNYLKETTTINKFALDGLNVELVGSAKVKGRPINQFCMDEYEGKFRIATTVSFEENNVYVFDENLKLSSKLEGIAIDEKIYASRFLGNKLYLVTFKQIDPFFVIDLSEEPKILGYIKLPGVSDYIHPYDEKHLIGFGRDVDEKNLRIKGLKITIFDVSDYSQPIELFSYSFGGEGSFSEALYEHKAFLFSKEKNLLVVPATVHKGTRFYPWLGVYVFNITLEDGIKLKGTIEHEEEFWMKEIKRAIYIDDVIYTISNDMIKANDMKNLEEIKSIKTIQPAPLK